MEIVKGTKVIVPAGTAIVSDFHPNAKFGATVKRDQLVTVNHVSSRMRPPQGCYHPTIRWAGSGGYWREVWLSEVEIAP